MSDLIRREDAIEQLNEAISICPPCMKGTGIYRTSALEEAIDIINQIPSADRPQGEWHFDEKGNFFCSECKSYPRSQYATTDYCPNCGAKMKSPWVLKGADDE